MVTVRGAAGPESRGLLQVAARGAARAQHAQHGALQAHRPGGCGLPAWGGDASLAHATHD